jgi:hypothetical protein
MAEHARRRDTMDVRISPVGLDGILDLPRPAKAGGIVLFAHGSGSGRLSHATTTWPLRSEAPAWSHCCWTC